MNQISIPSDIQKAIASKSIGSAFRARLSEYAEGMSMPAERDYLVSLYNDKSHLKPCTPDSLATVLLTAAYTGLSLNPQLGLLYVVPYKMEIGGKFVTVAQAQIGYKGLVKMAYRCSAISGIQATVVYSNDPVFEVWSDENGKHIRHVENMKGNRGQLTAVYVIAHFRSGFRHVEVMTAADIEKIMAAVRSKNQGKLTPAWEKWPEEQWKKSCLRRAWKYWPKDRALEDAETVVNQVEPSVGFGEPGSTPPDPEGELLISDQQHTELHAYCVDAAGIQPKQADRWLAGIADAMGCNGEIRDLPASRIDEAKKRIDDRVAAIRKKNEAKQ